MQPKTNVTLDRQSFDRIKKTALNMARCRKGLETDPCYHTRLPEEVGLQLTNRCNLRCRHCFEWSDKGYNHTTNKSYNAGELSLELIERVLEETVPTNANLFLWGGEPLAYSRWDELAEMVGRYKRWSVLCTNGITVNEQLDSLLPLSPYLAILTSLEGFEAENDAIRGKGSFAKAMNGIKEIIRLQRAGEFKGKQSVHCTISDSMIGKLYAFLEYMEDIGIDTLYYCFPWYIPEKVACQMDDYYREKFSFLDIHNEINSWHSFHFRIDPALTETLLKELEAIRSRSWNIRIRYQPAVEPEQVEGFVHGDVMPAQQKKRCLAVTNRMDILADGNVSACKLFSEFDVGNLYDSSVEEIWNSERFDHIRKILSEGLTPVCSKCVLLYLNGV